MKLTREKIAEYRRIIANPDDYAREWPGLDFVLSELDQALNEIKRLQTENALLKANLGHTQECLDYAATTGKPFCIAPCADQRRKLGGI